ncbi:MAG: gamma-glutamyltransferase [Acidobacteria bacterium]|nr:gamma-glutamyltransferase [Acidobacteriota bacterium]
MNRRRILSLAGGALVAGACGSEQPQEPAVPAPPSGAISAGGTEFPVAVGTDVLCCKGNAVDAAVSAALMAGVTELSGCGIAGYGGHMVIAMADGRVSAIDYNSTAPAAMRGNTFAPDEKGVVPQAHDHGWLSAGVPGTLAGMQMALEKFGTMSFAEALAPAIKAARDGVELSEYQAKMMVASKDVLAKDAGARTLLFQGGKPFVSGVLFRNRDLAAVLETLAAAGSAEPFYRGEIADKIAQAFAQNGGILTRDDLAAYEAEEVKTVSLEWRGYEIHTAPLTAGGVTMLEAVNILKALGWEHLGSEDEQTHARLEALRIAWNDRLTLFGDPSKVDVPLDHLASKEYADRMAERVRQAVVQREPLRIATRSREQNETVHISAVDTAGNMVALTLTHGVNFGARVVVEGLGLILGHGMSRFEPNPNHPNSPGPGKKPLHNMCPTVVLKDGRPVLALGGRGGRRIPNAVFDVLMNYVGQDRTMEESIEAPRMHTEGGLKVDCDAQWNDERKQYLRRVGYEVNDASSARVSAASFNPASGESSALSR